ncbi:hypothetical protein N7466_006316 [Penicillium verhagenii]|uniref:uncharacterized protein n=1 Tax=Penicillium verhagenii TaxID=1562060 RepID=UPI0025457B1A|nr:uncharacterized protein N7466_006316 [Penicillium verhagenii]KAJ5930823.1 hypothetical protein N7466_006316 [Penicillium verhagenii]
MSRLLDLPPEIRTLIFEYVLLAPLTPPPGPWSGREDRISLQDVHYQSEKIGPQNVFYKADDSREIPHIRLLLLNHQIHDETISIMRRKSRIPYRLDVMAIDEFELWPTWLLVPALRTHLGEVRMNLRIFGHCLDRKKAHAHRTDTGPYILKWCFYALLERFLIHGPLSHQVKAKADKESRKFFMDTLVIDVTAHPDETYRLASPELRSQDHWRWLCEHLMRRPLQPGHDLAGVMPRPKWVASHLSGEIDRLLRMEYHELYYGGVLYEHIGDIQILVEGTVYQSFNLAERLAPLTFQCDRSVFSWKDRKKYFWTWKKMALMKRSGAGLPVIWPEDPVLEDDIRS